MTTIDSGTVETNPRSPVFVLGYARSGTTLLRALLGAHPEIQMANEPEFLRALRASGLSLTSRLQPGDRPKLLASIDSITTAREFLDAVPDDRKRWLFSSTDDDIDARILYESLLGVTNNTAVWGEKSLGNVFHVDEILQVYPNAVFIHIVRDPRAALLSLYRKRFFASTDAAPPLDRNAIRFFAYHTHDWLAEMDMVLRLLRQTGPNTLVEVKYETLVQRPEDELRRLCAFLNLPFESAMLDPNRRTDDPALQGAGSFAHRALAEPVDRTRAAASREIPAFADHIVSTIAEAAMSRYEYPTAPPRLPLTVKLRLWAELCYDHQRLRRRLADMQRQRGAFPHGPVRPALAVASSDTDEASRLKLRRQYEKSSKCS